MTTALITGANSGIGRQTAVDLAGKGWNVYGAMRNLDKGAKLATLADDADVTVHPVVCDVTDAASVNRVVAEVTAAAGGIDVLVNNAGIGGNGVLEETPISTYEQVMDVNLFGVIRCTQAVLPQMRERASGTIVNLSSIAGRIAAIGQSPYSASKWALEGLSEGLAQELAPHGVRVVIIEPGIVKTAILAKNTDTPEQTGAYATAYRRMFQFYTKGLENPGAPSDVADIIYQAVTTDDPKLRWTCGWGGPELFDRPIKIDDQDWVSLAAIESDDEYAARFTELFGLQL
ncbi:MAG: SDR family oxidoreductase [Acidimicrobiales bacterium]